MCAAIEQHGSALNASGMGVGKTFESLAVAREFRKMPTVICPSAGITGWKRAGELMGVPMNVINWEMVRTGRTDLGRWKNPVILKPASQYIRNQNAAVIKPVDQVFSWDKGYNEMLVFDECHRANDPTSLNSQLVRAARRQGILCMGCSATPADNPLQMQPIGYMLGLHSDSDFWTWVRKFGVKPGDFGGIVFSGTPEQKRRAMKKIHDQLFPGHGVRRQTSEIPGFPEVQITAELYDVLHSDKISELYAEMSQPLARLAEKIASNNPIAELHPLTQRLRQRQEIELLMLPVIVELAKDARAQGFHVPIFVNFDESIDYLCEKLDTDCTITGRQVGTKGAIERTHNLDRFQADSDKDPWVIANSKCGGISISMHDLYGNRPRYSLVRPTDSAIDLKQIFGRTPRQGGKSKSYYRVVFASGTVEEKIHGNVSAKLNNLDSLTDGDLSTENLKL